VEELAQPEELLKAQHFVLVGIDLGEGSHHLRPRQERPPRRHELSQRDDPTPISVRGSEVSLPHLENLTFIMKVRDEGAWTDSLSNGTWPNGVPKGTWPIGIS